MTLAGMMLPDMTRLARRILRLIAILAAGGALVSSVSLYHHYGASKTSYCDFGESFNCDIVNRSTYSAISARRSAQAVTFRHQRSSQVERANPSIWHRADASIETISAVQNWAIGSTGRMFMPRSVSNPCPLVTSNGAASVGCSRQRERS